MVVVTTVNETNRLTELDIDGEIIRCTETHPFGVKGKGWVDACELAPGDVVYTKDWNTATVNSVSLLELDEPVEVFNFEVEDFHTYFVGDGLVLVHNALCHQSKEWRAERKRYWKGEAKNYENRINDKLSDSGNYIVSKDNIRRMKKGNAPIGIDERPVNLHHVEGIKTNLYNYVEMTWTQHFSNFKALHMWLFG